jgi:hypothetical protein
MRYGSKIKVRIENPFKTLIIQLLSYLIVKSLDNISSPITAESRMPFDLIQQARRSKKFGKNKG